MKCLEMQENLPFRFSWWFCPPSRFYDGYWGSPRSIPTPGPFKCAEAKKLKLHFPGMVCSAVLYVIWAPPIRGTHTWLAQNWVTWQDRQRTGHWLCWCRREQRWGPAPGIILIRWLPDQCRSDSPLLWPDSTVGLRLIPGNKSSSSSSHLLAVWKLSIVLSKYHSTYGSQRKFYSFP